MTEMKELSVQEKRELKSEQATREGSYFEPAVDIYETPQALVVVADVPGAKSETIEMSVRDSLLSFSARVAAPEARWKPLYEEYGVGHYSRQFKLGHQIDQTKISAQIKDGVLTLTLPKAEAAQPRKINVQTIG